MWVKYILEYALKFLKDMQESTEKGNSLASGIGADTKAGLSSTMA